MGPFFELCSQERAAAFFKSGGESSRRGMQFCVYVFLSSTPLWLIMSPELSHLCPRFMRRMGSHGLIRQINLLCRRSHWELEIRTVVPGRGPKCPFVIIYQRLPILTETNKSSLFAAEFVHHPSPSPTTGLTSCWVPYQFTSKA